MKDWKDITLRKAIKLAAIKEEDPIDEILEVLATALDLSRDEVESKWTMEEIIEKYKEFEFTKTLPKERNDKTFKHKGVRYGLCDFSKMKMAQMVDIEEFYSAGLVDNLHNIISILYQPVKSYNILTKKYTLGDYEFNEEAAKSFLDLDMDFVWGNALFFCRIEKEYTTALRDYLAQTAEKMMTQAKKRGEELLSQTFKQLQKSESERSGTGSE